MSSGLRDDITISWLPDGKRLSMRHGPIDLVIEAAGNAKQVEQAYRQAAHAFETVLSDLTAELPALRTPLDISSQPLQGSIARRMYQAADKVAGQLFATPMIAVAGSVADHMLRSMVHGTQLTRAYVNNGGDIALHLAPAATFDIGVCENIETGRVMCSAHIHARDKIRGIATSGWRGRSHSLGIADAVTVLAQDAALADAAATLIANSINLPDHPGVTREPADELAPDSDLGHRPVTVDISKLSEQDIDLALGYGKHIASEMIDQGSIIAVYASLQGKTLRLAETPGDLNAVQQAPHNLFSTHTEQPVVLQGMVRGSVKEETARA